jgi:methyl-accepting chemotaxis protein
VVKKELKESVNQIEGQMSIKKFLHVQLIKIGFIVGIFMGVLGIFAIYEGIQLVTLKSEGYKISKEAQIIFTIALIGIIVIGSILMIDILLNRIARNVIKRISDPVNIMDEAMGELASGNLENQVMYDTKDEFFNMIGNTKKAMLELKKYISSISDTLHQMSEKNLNVKIEEEYIGDFAKIRTSLLDIVESFNSTMFEMKTAFTQVRDGANSMADTAQSMANGAEQQSKYIRELLDRVEKISALVHENTTAAEGVEQLSTSSIAQMEELITAMNSIRDGSNEITSIIEVITKIALQTNLLALNASIEAAHAGEQGKGFAVVATEIGTLANSSAEASKNITELIQKSISAVNNGVEVTNKTAEMLTGISKNITTITDSVRNQEIYLKDMVDSANEVADVIDENTAAAQQSSALSEELLGYTENVVAMIEQYNIYKS